VKAVRSGGTSAYRYRGAERYEPRDFAQVDLTIVRGLAYYTGIVFELFDSAKKLRAICGGGRYDDLLKALGGPDLPALGFGMETSCSANY